jgi:hypothetical protein
VRQPIVRVRLLARRAIALSLVGNIRGCVDDLQLAHSLSSTELTTSSSLVWVTNELNLNQKRLSSFIFDKVSIPSPLPLQSVYASYSRFEPSSSSTLISTPTTITTAKGENKMVISRATAIIDAANTFIINKKAKNLNYDDENVANHNSKDNSNSMMIIAANLCSLAISLLSSNSTNGQTPTPTNDANLLTSVAHSSTLDASAVSSAVSSSISGEGMGRVSYELLRASCIRSVALARINRMSNASRELTRVIHWIDNYNDTQRKLMAPPANMRITNISGSGSENGYSSNKGGGVISMASQSLIRQMISLCDITNVLQSSHARAISLLTTRKPLTAASSYTHAIERYTQYMNTNNGSRDNISNSNNNSSSSKIGDDNKCNDHDMIMSSLLINRSSCLLAANDTYHADIDASRALVLIHQSRTSLPSPLSPSPSPSTTSRGEYDWPNEWHDCYEVISLVRRGTARAWMGRLVDARNDLTHSLSLLSSITTKMTNTNTNSDTDTPNKGKSSNRYMSKGINNYWKHHINTIIGNVNGTTDGINDDDTKHVIASYQTAIQVDVDQLSRAIDALPLPLPSKAWI